VRLYHTGYSYNTTTGFAHLIPTVPFGYSGLPGLPFHTFTAIYPTSTHAAVTDYTVPVDYPLPLPLVVTFTVTLRARLPLPVGLLPVRSWFWLPDYLRGCRYSYRLPRLRLYVRYRSHARSSRCSAPVTGARCCRTLRLRTITRHFLDHHALSLGYTVPGSHLRLHRLCCAAVIRSMVHCARVCVCCAFSPAHLRITHIHYWMRIAASTCA